MTTLSQTDIANLALMRLGQRKCQAIDDAQDPNARAMLVAWPQAFGEVGRSAPWNCLRARVMLSQLPPQPGSSFTSVPTAVPWTPNTVFAQNTYVTFGNPAYLYFCLIGNTSSSNFTNDLTRGWWQQTDMFSPNYLSWNSGNAGTLYEWNYAYALPSDFLLLVELNGQNCWKPKGVGSLYEVYQKNLYCNSPYADIKYNQAITDTTTLDPMFTGALELKLAELTATTLRKDDAKLSITLHQLFESYIQEARQKNAAEAKPRRYNIVSESRFVRSRWRSTNG